MSHGCPEREYRDGLTDEEFWNYVLLRQRPDDPLPEFTPWDDDVQDADVAAATWAPCLVCGEVICGYDAEGRPMTHVSLMEDE